MDKTTINSFLYEMYKVKQIYGHLIDNMEKITLASDYLYPKEGK